MTIINMPAKAGPRTPPRKPSGGNFDPPIPKYIICLKCLWDRASEGMTELEALSAYGDTCLHSTISYLANNHGIAFKRKWEDHTHRHGGTTQFKRYWLQLPAQAKRLLSFYYAEDELCL